MLKFVSVPLKEFNYERDNEFVWTRDKGESSPETKDDLQNHHLHHLKMKAMGIINISYLLISLSLMDDERSYY